MMNAYIFFKVNWYIFMNGYISFVKKKKWMDTFHTTNENTIWVDLTVTYYLNWYISFLKILLKLILDYQQYICLEETF